MIKLMKYAKSNPHGIHPECVVTWRHIPSTGEIRKYIKHSCDYGMELLLRNRRIRYRHYIYYLERVS